MKVRTWVLAIFVVCLLLAPVVESRGGGWVWWNWPHAWVADGGWFYLVATADGLWGWSYEDGEWRILEVNHVRSD